MVAVIFDMDGVIVDSERYWEENTEDVLEEAVASDEVSFSDVQGMNVMDQYDHITEEFTVNISKEEYFARYDEKAAEVYQEHVDLLQGFRQMLEQIRADGIPVALVSSSFRHWIQMVLDRFELDDAFSLVVSAEDIDGRSKPAPDIYIYAAEQLGVDPGECVVIEDSSHGVNAAKNAGMRCIGFRTDINAAQDLSHADIIVEGEEELQEFFREKKYRTLVEGP